MSPRKTWLDARVDVALSELKQYGLNMPRDRMSSDIQARVAAVAAQMGITEKSARTYITDDVVRTVARDLAVSVAHEAPGGDPLELPATHTIPTGLVGRTIAGLSIVAQLAAANPPATPDELIFDVSQPTQLIFHWGIAVERALDGAVIRIHEALVHRTIRELNRAVASLREGAQTADGNDPEKLAEALERNVQDLQAEL
ncbi:hypothetical protein [Nocardia nova]|uniref:hypothetical protein n=1 Tax=Nocardia nova TaxID=37330 RepID=UPI0027394607|nr:hypothetical protein [Nocardia nova]